MKFGEYAVLLAYCVTVMDGFESDCNFSLSGFMYMLHVMFV